MTPCVVALQSTRSFSTIFLKAKMRNLNEIECFVKAVELKSLTAAAKALSCQNLKSEAKSKILKNVSCMTCQDRQQTGVRRARRGPRYFLLGDATISPAN